MKQYFFDIVSAERTFHDFQGRTFESDGEAGQHAQLLAIHMQYDPDCAASDWKVLVRDAPGTVVQAVPVPPPDPRCAVAGQTVRFKLDTCAFGDLVLAAV
jgi:Domain of unknown function (DUF6894)